jgi:hypothetical protein
MNSGIIEDYQEKVVTENTNSTCPDISAIPHRWMRASLQGQMICRVTITTRGT